MSITIDLATTGRANATLQFNCPVSGLFKQTFEVQILNVDLPPVPPGALSFEVKNEPMNKTPNWICKLDHPDGRSYIKLKISGAPDRRPIEIPVAETPGGWIAGPFSVPDPDSWLFAGAAGQELHLYFEWVCSDGSVVPADNAVPPGVEAGYPLHVLVIGGSPGGKKIKILLPGPAGPAED